MSRKLRDGKRKSTISSVTLIFYYGKKVQFNLRKKKQTKIFCTDMGRFFVSNIQRQAVVFKNILTKRKNIHQKNTGILIKTNA